MRVMAQVAMVMNLDKCIGCHTCSVTCKQVWTNRPGTEYVYFNNVETKPGTGYPRRYEDQEQWKGGWTLDRKGRLQLKSGSRLRRLLSIFYNPDLPSIDDYGDPWTYDYQTLINAPLGTPNPSAHSISALTGRDMSPRWGSNWDDDLAGGPRHAAADPDLAGLDDRVKMEFEQVFMFYLPRICEHCLNPSCVASCPSGAMYKREEDGIVLVDQDRCRGWRFCVSGCPYKKVYFNHRTGKAEKCTLCFPRIEAGQPTICSETCVGRLRYLGLFLYDADKVLAAAATPDPQDLYQAQLSVFLDPDDPAVAAEAARQGIPADWIDAAAPLPGLRAGRPAQGRAAAAPGVPDPADGLVHPAAVPGRRRGPRGRLRPRRPRPGVRRHRRAAHPGRVPGQPVHRGRRRRHPGGAAQARRRPRLDAGAAARARRPDEACPPRWARPRPTWRTCTGCWRSPSTTTAT